MYLQKNAITDFMPTCSLSSVKFSDIIVTNINNFDSPGLTTAGQAFRFLTSMVFMGLSSCTKPQGG